MKKIVEDGKIRPCPQIGRINIRKMAIVLKAINTFKAISIKIPTQSFPDLERTIFLTICRKKFRITEAILNN